MRAAPLPDAPVKRPSAAAAVWAGVFAYLVAVALLIAVAVGTYGFFKVTDVGYYWKVSDRIALGLRPYVDFPFEYPPLASLFIRLPRYAAALGVAAQYPYVFAAEMLALGAGAAIAVGLAAARVWSGPARLVPPLAFAAGTLACGAIVANRFDTALALTIAVALLLVVRQRHVAAGAVLGAGFALKLIPVLLLPLAVLSARRRWAVVAAFCVAAAAPFLPYIGAPYLAGFVRFHAERPLQFESVLATPFLLAHALGVMQVGIATTFGSQALVAPGADLLASLSAPAGLAAIAATYVVVLRRPACLRPENVALPMLAVLLAFLTFGKVLSPQFLVWCLPPAALLVPRYPRLSALLLVVAVLTQIEFPGLFYRLIALDPLAIGVVTLRNVGIAAAWATALVNLWRLPPATRPSEDQGDVTTAARSRTAPSCFGR
jgi:hypothetical protein